MEHLIELGPHLTHIVPGLAEPQSDLEFWNEYLEWGMVSFDLLLAILLRAIRGLLAVGRRVITIVFLSSGAV